MVHNGVRRPSGTSIMKQASLLLTCLVALLASVVLASPSSSSPSATGARVLVLNSPSSPETKFSAFAGNLAAKGFDLTWRDAASSTPKLSEYDERQYDHIVFLGTDVDKLAADLNPQALVSFAKDGGNILFAFDSQRANWLRDLGREFSVEITDKGETLIDHFNYAKSGSLDDGSHSTVFVGGSQSALAPNQIVFSPETFSQAHTVPLLFGKSAPHRLGSNPQGFSLVAPSSTSHTTTKSGQLNLLGTDDGISLVSSFQLKDNSARVTFLGSIDFLSDDFVELQSAKSSSGKTYTDTLNAAVSNDLTLWTFQSHGVLKVTRTSHRRVRSSPTDIREPYEESADGSVAKMYRIKDNVIYGLELAQFDLRKGGWVPAPQDLDMQVKLIMIDPFITTNLTAQSSSSTSSSANLDALEDFSSDSSSSSQAHTLYTSTFMLPDRLGVYTFQTHWSRSGWSFINVKDTTPIRAFNHDENPRYLPASWPYFAASLSTIVGFLLLTALLLFTGEKADKLKTQ